MPRHAKPTQPKKASKPIARKRKSEVLEAEQEAAEGATSDTEESIVLIAKQVAAKSQNQQQRLRKDQYEAFLEKIGKIDDGVPAMFDNYERDCLIHTKMLRLHELLLRRNELDLALTEQTLNLGKFMSAAQRSLKTAIQTRKDELLDLRKMLMSDTEAQAGSNPDGC